MDLLSTYEEYTEFQKEYVIFIEELFNSNLNVYSEDVTIKRLTEAKKKFELLMDKSSEIVIESKDADNLKDLRYLIVDALFLSTDLLGFYQYKEVERFKMRVNNYINKLRRSELFKETNSSSCRV
ncbi:MAG: hypothetical protein RR620_00125 [Clostridium sp.]